MAVTPNEKEKNMSHDDWKVGTSMRDTMDFIQKMDQAQATQEAAKTRQLLEEQVHLQREANELKKKELAMEQEKMGRGQMGQQVNRQMGQQANTESEPCYVCKGSGRDGSKCLYCNGKGCDKCNYTGKGKCYSCGGTGKR